MGVPGRFIAEGRDRRRAEMPRKGRLSKDRDRLRRKAPSALAKGRGAAVKACDGEDRPRQGGGDCHPAVLKIAISIKNAASAAAAGTAFFRDSKRYARSENFADHAPSSRRPCGGTKTRAQAALTAPIPPAGEKGIPKGRVPLAPSAQDRGPGAEPRRAGEANGNIQRS